MNFVHTKSNKIHPLPLSHNGSLPPADTQLQLLLLALETSSISIDEALTMMASDNWDARHSHLQAAVKEFETGLSMVFDSVRRLEKDSPKVVSVLKHSCQLIGFGCRKLVEGVAKDAWAVEGKRPKVLDPSIHFTLGTLLNPKSGQSQKVKEILGKKPCDALKLLRRDLEYVMLKGNPASHDGGSLTVKDAVRTLETALSVVWARSKVIVPSYKPDVGARRSEGDQAEVAEKRRAEKKREKNRRARERKKAKKQAARASARASAASSDVSPAKSSPNDEEKAHTETEKAHTEAAETEDTEDISEDGDENPWEKGPLFQEEIENGAKDRGGGFWGSILSCIR